MASAGARDLRGYGGKAPGQGFMGTKSPEAESFLHFQRLICVEYVHAILLCMFQYVYAIRFFRIVVHNITNGIYCNFMR